MRKSRLNWKEFAPGAFALLLALASVIWADSNRSKQLELAENQQKIAKAQAVANVSKALVELLAKTATETNDPQIRQLLARNGVTFNASLPTVPAVVPSPAPGTNP